MYEIGAVKSLKQSIEKTAIPFTGRPEMEQIWRFIGNARNQSVCMYNFKFHGGRIQNGIRLVGDADYTLHSKIDKGVCQGYDMTAAITV
jgi:hypothetical protein